MTIQYSVAVRNAQLQVIEDRVGVSTTAHLTIYTGTAPATAATTETGTRLLNIPLPSNFFNAPSGGVMTKTGNWQATAIGTGTAGYFRLNQANGSTQGIVQGSVGVSAADLIVDSVAFVTGQIFTVVTFTITHNQG